MKEILSLILIINTDTMLHYAVLPTADGMT